MKPVSFDYLRAESVEEALDALHREGSNVRILAGGQSLMPMLNMRLARPAVLVDIVHVNELKVLETRNGALFVGAAVRQAAVQRHDGVATQQPLLSQALEWVGHAQTRARGTICGSIAHADPSAEIPTVLLALGGMVHLRSKKSRKDRVLAADAFVTGMMSTAKADDEMIVGATFPARKPGHGYAFQEIGRRHGDFAIVACAAVVNDREATLTVGGVADQPTKRQFPLPGSPQFDDALNQFAWDLNARDDLHASARYRRDLVRHMGRKTIEEAAACRA
jgi:2-furoyl-CoA dehydrogenase FAD binding subunit